ncbi:MAG: hypothetical protein N3E49_07745 [Bacteroidia bacterium]|nr:hypothetical protein [Bacteroidia bacterium]
MRYLGILVGVLWAQYYTPHLLSTMQTQATLLHEPINANPAAVFPLERFHLGVNSALYLPAPELIFYSGGGSYTWDTLQSVHLLWQRWGFDKIHHSEIGAGYALRLVRSRLTLAVRARLLSTTFSEYGRLYQGTPDVGFTLKLGGSWYLGGYGYNLLAKGWGNLPGRTQYGIGLSYQPSPIVQTLTEVTQQENTVPQVRTALVYVPHALLILRVGVCWPILGIGAGWTLRYKKVSLDVGYGYQPTTGNWASVGVSMTQR